MTDQSLTTIDIGYVELGIQAWLASKFRLSGSHKTQENYERTLRHFQALLATTGRSLGPVANAKEHTPEALRQSVSELALAAQGFAGMSTTPGRIVASTTYNQRLAVPSSFYTFATKRNLILAENPISKVDQARVQAYQYSEAMDPEEVCARMRAIDRSTRQGARDWCILAILLQTGRRLSEVADLRWRHVQVKGDKVTLVFEHCKGGKTMRDTLPPSIAKALLDYLGLIYGEVRFLNGKAPLWISFRRQAAKQDASATPPPLTIRSVANICEKHLGVSKVHVTRHTWARTMEDAGAKVSDIQARLGHESLATTGRYLAALKQDVNPQAADIASIFGLS